MDQTSRPIFNTAGLFTPGRLGPYSLPHRLLMAPLTRNRARRDGVPSPSAVIYYAQRASAAVIVTEATTVSEQAVGYPLTPGIHTADQVAGWRPVVDAVHRFGCRFFLQLFHAGRVSHPSLQPGDALPVAPSPIAPNGQTQTYQGATPFVSPRALALEEIPNIVEQFRVAAHKALAGWIRWRGDPWRQRLPARSVSAGRFQPANRCVRWIVGEPNPAAPRGHGGRCRCLGSGSGRHSDLPAERFQHNV